VLTSNIVQLLVNKITIYKDERYTQTEEVKNFVAIKRFAGMG
jgi:hypothetical protein